jgi:ribokinase
MVSPDALVLTHALEKLRARDGLTHSRLDNSRSVEAAPLLGLAAVRRYAAVHDIELARAALDVVKECVRENLHGSHCIVADAVLGLGTFSEVYTRNGIEPRIDNALHSDLLGRRRTILLSNWRRLHEALGVPPAEPPSDRALRGTIERDVLRELARQLIRREEYSLGAKSVVMPYASENSARKMPLSRPGRVIVLGGAVMDATFHTKDVPPRGTSTEAYAFQLAPGGKGLWQSVAAARLGLDVALIAAVANDRFGHEIVNHLRDEGVDTSLLKLVDDANTPFTGVIEFELGDSLALNWPNQREVRLDIRDVDRLGQHFATCDAVLLTFEIPRETLEYTLSLVNRLDESRPIVIVTPGQPYPDTGSRAKLFLRSATSWRILGSSVVISLLIASHSTSMSPLGSCWHSASRRFAFQQTGDVMSTRNHSGHLSCRPSHLPTRSRLLPEMHSARHLQPN